MGEEMNAPAFDRKKTSPIQTVRSNRVHDARVLTSLPSGKAVPLLAIPLLREDGVRSGRIRLSFEMMETAEILMNAINVRAMAYLVPTLALERFQGSMDILNRAYEGKPAIDGGAVIPYIETAAFGAHGANLIYKYMGLHADPAELVNTMYTEAYNVIFNHRATNRSPDITKRTRLKNDDLAPAFWQHDGFRHIVPDFDQAVIDGEVALNVVNAKLPVRGIGFTGVTPGTVAKTGNRESDGQTRNYASAAPLNTANHLNAININMQGAVGSTGAFPDVWAEMQAAGITVSLSNIELAKKTAAFAKLRAQYTGHSDDYIINLLMDGIRVPDQHLTQPILLSDKSTIFGMSKRYASDAANLTESVVNGATFIDLGINLPPISTGGVIMVIVEITPEQMFERQKDPFLFAKNVDALPQYLRDTLDPEKVVVVPNNYVDVDHDTPNSTFGYAPLGFEWNITAPRIGGRFYRPAVDAGFDEDRLRIWAVETQNPVLSEDFYLCTNMHNKPFVVTNQDPFEVVGRGEFLINGNTVFGGQLVEASNDYDTVMAMAPTERIDKTP